MTSHPPPDGTPSQEEPTGPSDDQSVLRDLDPLPSPAADPLLTIEQVARRMQLSVASVSDLVVQGRLISLDRGRLIARGEINLPLIRASSVERAHKGRDPSKVNIDTSHGDGPHPAASVALNLLTAIEEGEPATVVALSTSSSLADVGSPEQLLVAWREALGTAISSDAGIATNGYVLEGYDAIAIRLVANALPLTVIIDRPTPMSVSGVIPFRRENGGWKADLALWQQRDAWTDQIWEV